MKSRFKLNSASESFTVSLPGGLLEIMDDCCDRYDFSRSSFVKRAVKKYIAQKAADDPAFWDQQYQKLNGDS